VSDPTLTLLAFLAGVVLVAVACGAAIALAAANHVRANESGLGSDEEFVRELLGYQAPRHPMNGGRHPDDEGAPT
jgi:hypothetical protein